MEKRTVESYQGFTLVARFYEGVFEGVVWGGLGEKVGKTEMTLLGSNKGKGNVDIYADIISSCLWHKEPDE